MVMKFRDSQLAHKYLDGLDTVIEIGASSHNPFNIKCNTYYNVDLPKHQRVVYEDESRKLGEEPCEVHIEARGDNLPLADNSVDAVLSSHVIEHFWNPLTALREWYRVCKPGGYIFIICPHKDRTFDKDREVTTIQELIDKSSKPDIIDDGDNHHTVWKTEEFVYMLNYFGYNVVEYQDKDDKVGNGFTVVIQVDKYK